MAFRAVVVFALAAVALLGASGARADWPAPIVEIDLDASPETRWTATIDMVLKTHGYDNTYKPIMDFMFSLVPEWLVNDAEGLLDLLDNDFAEYGQEIRGIAAAFENHGYGKNITLGRLVMMNLIYSETAACTSIVAQNKNGVIFHGRNLDYSIPGLTNITVEAHFISKGSVQYYGTTFAGYVGLLTGMRPREFSISLDERNKDPIPEGLIGNLVAALDGGKAVGMFLRSTLAQSMPFEDLIVRLNTTKLISPEYLIVAGVNSGDGAIITRNRTHADDSAGADRGVWRIDPPSVWFRLETNYDNWKAPPKTDDRRDPANKMMNALGDADVSLPSLFTVLSTAPVLNSHTVYTTLMSAALDKYQTVVRSSWD